MRSPPPSWNFPPLADLSENFELTLKRSVSEVGRQSHALTCTKVRQQKIDSPIPLTCERSGPGESRQGCVEKVPICSQRASDPCDGEREGGAGGQEERKSRLFSTTFTTSSNDVKLALSIVSYLSYTPRVILACAPNGWLGVDLSRWAALPLRLTRSGKVPCLRLRHSRPSRTRVSSTRYRVC